MKALAVLVHREAGIGSITRIESLSHVCQSHPALATRGSLRIKTILDFDAEIPIVRAVKGSNSKLNPSPIGQVGNAVDDCVLHERLKNQGGYHAIKDTGIDLLLHL